ncbi:Abi family protein [Cupriavidus agavae]|nr:Abi family protein [Cupriavidus agavae]
MQTSSCESFQRVVSLPRLNSYRTYFKTNTMDEAIGLYLWNGEVSSCFASHLAYFEIALRNSIHRAMSLLHSREASESFHWYDATWATLKQTSRNKINDVRERRPGCKLSPDEIVSSLSFGFWPVILNNLSPVHASRILSGVFCHHPLSARSEQWSDARVRRAALDFTLELQAFRNRLAHHEPLWKFRALRAQHAGAQAVILPPSRTQSDSLHRLRRLMTLVEDATGFIDRSLHDDLKYASWRQRLDFLLTERGVARYRLRQHVAAPTVLTPTEFRYRFTAIHRRNQPVKVRRAHVSGLFVPD